MLISYKKNFIYTKTFKTAGTSIEAFFEPFCMDEGNWSLKKDREEYVSDTGIIGHKKGPTSDFPSSITWWNHMPAKKIKEKVSSEVWNNSFKFCSVRNPFDKAVSAFYWSKNPRNGKAKNSAKLKLKKGIRSISKSFLKWEFGRWLRKGGIEVLKDRDRYMIDGEVCMDQFICFENLEDDVRSVCEKVDVPYDANRFPNLKSGVRSEQYSTSDHFNAASIDIVKEAFSWEISYFDYQVPKPS